MRGMVSRKFNRAERFMLVTVKIATEPLRRGFIGRLRWFFLGK